MSEISRLSLALALLVALAAVARAAEPILDCDPRGSARPVCGLTVFPELDRLLELIGP